MDLDLDFDEDFADDLDFDLNDFNEVEENIETRYLKPKVATRLKKTLKYKKALEFAEEFNLNKNERLYAIVSGDFIFGDIFEALVQKKKINIKNLYIATLSLSENNVDSLSNVVDMSKIENIKLFLSDYFYSHEKWNLIPYIYEELDKDDRLQVSFSSIHTKIALVETHDGMHYVFHGSANLRSSRNIEQICVEENKELFDFNKEILDEIEKYYFTINKSVRGKKLWQAVVQDTPK